MIGHAVPGIVGFQNLHGHFTLLQQFTDEDGNQVTLSYPYNKEIARTPQSDNLRTQLGKLGNTPFILSEVKIEWTENWFLPSSVIGEWRRQAGERLLQVRKITYRRSMHPVKQSSHPYPLYELTYLGNVMNSKAEAFYREHGVEHIEPAYEKKPVSDAALMFCKHCLRYSMGWCPTYQKGRSSYREPYYLQGTDGKRFRLEFDCKNCQMKVYAEK